MAWHIHENIVRGEIDNRTQGMVRGMIWLAGETEPLMLQLAGEVAPDLAGCMLQFVNPNPRPGDTSRLARVQTGVCGLITAAHVRVPDVPFEEPPQSGVPIHSSIYVEWFSDFDGRVLIESADYRTTISGPNRQPASGGTFVSRRMPVAARGAAGSKSQPDEDKILSEQVDRILRINEMKHEAQKLAGGKMLHGSEPNLPLEIEVDFWKNVLAFEKAPRMTRFEMLERDGIRPPAPESLGESELSRALWDLIETLGRRRIHLYNTNHLSDRELYCLLIEKVLTEETVVLPDDAGWNCTICVDEYGSPHGETGLEVYLRYYADEFDREHWAETEPGLILPPREDPPYARDDNLPKRED
jgi:hypothetical protein